MPIDPLDEEIDEGEGEDGGHNNDLDGDTITHAETSEEWSYLEEYLSNSNV